MSGRVERCFTSVLTRTGFKEQCNYPEEVCSWISKSVLVPFSSQSEKHNFELHYCLHSTFTVCIFWMLCCINALGSILKLKMFMLMSI